MRAQKIACCYADFREKRMVPYTFVSPAFFEFAARVAAHLWFASTILMTMASSLEIFEGRNTLKIRPKQFRNSSILFQRIMSWLSCALESLKREM